MMLIIESKIFRKHKIIHIFILTFKICNRTIFEKQRILKMWFLTDWKD